MRALDRFCYKYDRYGIKNLIAIIMFGNAAVFFAVFIGLPVVNYISFDPALVLRGQVWRLITFAFIPDSFDLFFIFFLLFYFWIGRLLESQWGCMKFTLFYLGGMLFTVLYGFLLHFITVLPTDYPVTASAGISLSATYVNLTLFLAAATLFPDMEIRLFFILPVKMKWLAILYAALTLMIVFVPPYSLKNLAPFVALGNYILFFYPNLLKAYRRARKRRGFGSRSPKLKILRTRPAGSAEASRQAYRHRCTVCGATDISEPELEFRYCSLCSGAKCYCSRHIFEHEHS